MFINQLHFFNPLGWALLNSMWQLALLWLLYRLLISTFSDLKSHHKSTLATTLLFSGFLWFLITIFFFSQKSSQSFLSIPGTEIDKSNWSTYINTVLPYISILYLLLLLIPVYRFITNYKYAAAIRQSGSQKASIACRVYVKKIAAQLNIRKRVQVFVSEFLQSPVTVGFLKPVILLPVAAISHLSVQQVEALLLHELAHIRRNDYLLNMFIQLIQATLYFNPFVKAFVKEIETEREKSCDDLVLQYQYDATGYATALLNLQQTATPVFFMAATGKPTGFVNRINYILGKENKKRKHAGITIISILFLGTFLLSGILNTPGKNNNTGFTSDKSSLSFSASPVVYSSIQYPATNKIAEPEKSNSAIALIERKKKKEISNPVLNQTIAEPTEDSDNSNFKLVRFTETPVIVLEPEQDKQVKLAVSASKKIAGELQWKKIENNLAEVFTVDEKKEIHKIYSEAFNGKDWSPLENKLKSTYNEIDWQTVNARFSNILKQMQADSLRLVYSNAINKLDEITSLLNQNQITGIPDTDITLNSITEKKAGIILMLEKLKSLRDGRKIIDL